MRACKAADLVAKFGGFEILFLVAVWAMNWMGGMKRAEGRGALTVFSEAETLFFFFPSPGSQFSILVYVYFAFLSPTQNSGHIYEVAMDSTMLALHLMGALLAISALAKVGPFFPPTYLPS